MVEYMAGHKRINQVLFGKQFKLVASWLAPWLEKNLPENGATNPCMEEPWYPGSAKLWYNPLIADSTPSSEEKIFP